MQQRMVRQGDVLLVACARKPAGAMRVQRQAGARVILAEGEATGHAHAFVEDDVEEYEAKGERYIRIVSSPRLLRHEEHAPIEVPAGWWKLRRQREYSPEEIRRVAD